VGVVEIAIVTDNNNRPVAVGVVRGGCLRGFDSYNVIKMSLEEAKAYLASQSIPQLFEV